MLMYIAGEWVDGEKHIPVLNPYDNTEIDTIPSASPEDVERAVESAQRGAAVMEALPCWKRCEILDRVADLMLERKEGIARLLTMEHGKTIKESRTEIERVATTLRTSANVARTLVGEVLPMASINLPEIQNKFGFTYRVPVGVVLAIAPFNVPVNLAAHKLATAFAAGNAVILKPATDTPLATCEMIKAFLEAGAPAESIQYITGPGSLVGNLLCPDKRIRKISFTGSHKAGEQICKMAGMKKVTMELGGNAPVLVLKDANPEKVASSLLSGYGMSGQACTSTQRTFVHKDLYEDVLSCLKEKLERYVEGNPLDENTTMGPVIRASDAERIMSVFEDARAKGARIVCGNRRVVNYVAPTIVADMTCDMRIFTEELFGPGIGFMPFEDLDEAVRMANDTNYGLAAGIFTQDIDKAMQLARRIKAGNVHINAASNWRSDPMPFGGLKDSGIGKEGPKYAIEEMTDKVTVVMHLEDRAPC